MHVLLLGLALPPTGRGRGRPHVRDPCLVVESSVARKLRFIASLPGGRRFGAMEEHFPGHFSVNTLIELRKRCDMQANITVRVDNTGVIVIRESSRIA